MKTAAYESAAGAAARAGGGGPLHVMHLIESLGAGGAERLLYTNLKHLDGGRVRSSVVTVFAQPDHWAGEIRGLGVPVESLGCHSLRDLPAGVARLRRRLRATRPDLLHTHLWAANVIGRVAGRLAGVPVISSVHNPDHEPEAWEDGAGVSRWKRHLSLVLDRWTARAGCVRMVAVSDYVRRCAHRRLKFPLERIDLLYNPIDTDALASPPARGREQLLGECSLDANSLVLLNAGRVSPQKGLIYAVRAMPAILARHPSAQLISAGPTSDSAWLERLKAEAEALGVGGRVHFLGARRDVADLLRACDLFIFPSLYEGLGIALVEAMAAGRACVATDTGPIPEVVTHGVDGWLVPTGNAEALAEAVCALLDDAARREALGRAAAASARTRFQPQAAADELARIYEAVVARSGVAAAHELTRGPSGK
ncbi:MAG TPA: glycosyltransferase family 4 protein [Pyrinomonadaceae bacterium]|jgi:glycosyltransferase involved in cell wall biosynthesis|nr:glycosyltransferase family 4 protein [Pyrinomonadaceae bacterium]